MNHIPTVHLDGGLSNEYAVVDAQNDCPPSGSKRALEKELCTKIIGQKALLPGRKKTRGKSYVDCLIMSV